MTDLIQEEDLPIEGYSNDEDLPLDLPDAKPPKPEFIDNTNKANASILKAYNDESTIPEAYKGVELSDDTEVEVNLQASKKSDKDSLEYQEMFAVSPGENANAVLENAKLTQEMMDEAEQDRTKVGKQVVDAASTVETDPEIAKAIEVRIQMLNDIQKLVEDYTIPEIAWDMAKEMLPIKRTWDTVSLTGDVFAEETVRQMVLNFKRMTPDEQAEMWPRLKEEILDELPTNRSLQLLSAFADPVGEESLDDFGSFWAALDVAEIGLIGVGIAKRIAKLTKQMNSIKVLNKLANADQAAQLNAAAVVDKAGEVAKKANIDDITAYNNAVPFNVASIDDAYTEGLSAKTIKNIKKVEERQRAVARSLTDERSFLKESAVNDLEREVAEKAYTRSLVESGFENIKLVDKTPEASYFSYDLVMDGERLTDVGRMDLTEDIITGTYKQLPHNTVKNFFVSPSVLAKGVAAEDFKAAIRLDSTAPKVGELMKTMQREALAPIIGKRGLKLFKPGIGKSSVRNQLAEIDTVLLAGDDAGEVFSAAKLKAGVNGVRLEDNQIEAYYNLRNLYDNLWTIRNAEERRKMVFRGMREIKLKHGAEVGKPFEDLAGAQGYINSGAAKEIFIDNLGFSKEVGKINLKKMYEEGYQLVRLDNAIKVGDSRFQTILARKVKIGDLPDRVMHWREGYVPRVNKNAYWFAKEFDSVKVDGITPRDAHATKTHRFFDNRKEAEEWLESYKLENPKTDMRILEDREMEKLAIGSSKIGAGGGIYTGPRASEAIPFGIEGLPAERFSSYEALNMNLNNLQNYTTRNMWRMGMEKKWVNTAKELGFDVRSFDPAGIKSTTQSGRGLKKMGEIIQDWAGFPTESELFWDATVQNTIEWAMNKGFNRKNLFVRGLHNLRHKDPVAAMRSIAFHSLLGVYNPVQLWVQAQGASIAVSLATTADDPLRLSRVLKDQMFLAMASKTDNVALRAKMAKLSGHKVSDLDEIVDLWRRSGLEDSIKQTADYAASARSYGVTSDAVRMASDNGLMFYRAGELFNRRTSFLTALEEFKFANPGVKVSDDALKGILSRANNMMLNLSKANRAQWQKGFLSLPTQFMQVQAKILESLIGQKWVAGGESINHSFSATERFKILTGQLALYGAAGIPMGNWAVKQVADWFGIDQNEIEKPENRLAVKAINEGFWGTVALASFGADVEVGNRGAVASGLTNFLFDLMSSDAALSDKLLGAFSQAPYRFFKAWEGVKPITIGVLQEKRFPTKEEALLAAQHLSTVASSFSNLEKAFFMNQFNLLRDRNGYPVDSGDFSLGTEIGTLIGFEPSQQRLKRDLTVINKSVSEAKKHTVSMLTKSFWNYTLEEKFAETDKQREELVEKYVSINSAILKSLGTPNLQEDAMKAFVDKVTKGDTAMERAIKQYFDNFVDGRTNDLFSLHAEVVSKGIVRTGVLDEEK